jgi:hypothetical protein
VVLVDNQPRVRCVSGGTSSCAGVDIYVLDDFTTGCSRVAAVSLLRFLNSIAMPIRERHDRELRQLTSELCTAHLLALIVICLYFIST